MKHAAEVKQEFADTGVSIREWADANGFNPRTVYAVLNGTLKCRRGVSHNIAVALGMKERKTPRSILKHRESRGLAA